MKQFLSQRERRRADATLARQSAQDTRECPVCRQLVAVVGKRLCLHPAIGNGVFCDGSDRPAPKASA